MEKNEDFVGFSLEAGKYQTLLTEKYKNRKTWSAPNPKEILSHIPGTIVDILVHEGQALKKGDLLLIHEAMKMQNRVVMPFDGVIAKINVSVGEKIAKNIVMIELQ